MTSQEPKNSHHVDPAGPTEVIAVPAPAPVFVDSTGRRSRFLRRLALAFGVVLLGYGALIGVSLAGGPVSMSAVLPLPGLEDDRDEKKPQPVPKTTPTPDPAPSTTPARRIIESADRGESVPRRPVTTTATPKAAAKPSRSPSPKPSPSVSSTPVVTKPLESGTVSQPPKPNPGTSTTTTTTTPPPAPVPPAVETTRGGTGAGLPVAPVPPPVVEEKPAGSGGAGGGGPAPESTTRPGPVVTGPPARPVVTDDPADSATPPTRAAP
ncbi:hypothetical protein [Actinoplanes utahensis]|uniref:hypothetical protein n=1 Tax=Actinoplanes utahensis TaxID=1869 RepID=UPI0005BC6C96|nr:hypothetical protein [Actinoplanes utahensis]GIF29219.1 hypothetical protein Aut01nite_22050 [Actinoplanes utahensis]